jgi:GT2 family glycosyltransferase
MRKKQNIAILLTCHNRKNKTISCLTVLFEATLPKGFAIEVFLVDDGSTDGTSQAIKEKFPSVTIIQGDGHLYWNRGMHLAWKKATKTKEYDFYLWLNDDTILDTDAIVQLFTCYDEIKLADKESIITAACRKEKDGEVFSYGGRNEYGPVIPNNKLQECTYINGNLVLIPKTIYQKIGINSLDYTHGMGDFDYGLRAIKAGFNCYTTKQYIATCPTNEGIPAWCNPQTPMLKRLKLLYSPRGLNLKEYILFRKKFWGWSWIIYMLKAYCKALSPSLYNLFKK